MHFERKRRLSMQHLGEGQPDRRPTARTMCSNMTGHSQAIGMFASR